MDYCFRDKRALITGVGKGIGRSCAIRLAQAGATVVGISKTQANLHSLKTQCPSIETVCVDLADWDATRKAVEGLTGHFDFLVNNAGIGLHQPFLDITEENLNKTYDVNLKSVVNVSQVVARRMVEHGTGGSIVNVSSQASLISLQDHTVYASSKAALDSVTKHMAFELGQHKIRVNSVNPTVVLTELGKAHWGKGDAKATDMLSRIPLGRFAEESEVVDAILFLLSSKSSMITGSVLPVDGGRLTN